MKRYRLMVFWLLVSASGFALPVVDFSGIETLTISAASPSVSQIYVFTDTSCPYCALFHVRRDELLRQGIDIHYLFYPRSGPESSAFRQAVAVWCSRDRFAALALALRGRTLPEADCEHPIELHYDLARHLNLLGTPAIITADGTVHYGYVSIQTILGIADTPDRVPTRSRAE